MKGAYPSIDVAGVVQLDPEPFTDRSGRMVSMHQNLPVGVDVDLH